MKLQDAEAGFRSLGESWNNDLCRCQQPTRVLRLLFQIHPCIGLIRFWVCAEDTSWHYSRTC